MRGVSLALLLHLFVSVDAAHADPVRLAVVLLPTRDAAAQQAVNRLRQTLATAWGIAETPSAPSEVTSRLGAAESLALAGQLDEAAAALDAALEDGAARLGVGIPGDTFVRAHIRRASIAVARKETERASEILTRLRRWDGGFVLEPSEAGRQLQALFTQLPTVLSPSEEELNKICRQAEVLVVARRAAGGALELTRIEHCQKVGSASWSPADDAPINEWAAKPPVAPRKTSNSQHRAGVAVAVTGAVFVGVAVVLGAVAGARRSAVGTGCDLAMPCTTAELASRVGLIDNLTISSAVLGALGGTTMITGIAVALASRRAR